jgi:ABC-type Fe3+-hydroxamate transport system substrate-binding protein
MKTPFDFAKELMALNIEADKAKEEFDAKMKAIREKMEAIRDQVKVSKII